MGKDSTSINMRYLHMNFDIKYVLQKMTVHFGLVIYIYIYHIVSCLPLLVPFVYGIVQLLQAPWPFLGCPCPEISAVRDSTGAEFNSEVFTSAALSLGISLRPQKNSRVNLPVASA